ncbi:hypothetical protein BS78_02G073100 [Paspalum vaginatum]|nr:hypothetical protein BS78_02G073100 [Paspalum vaginatum]
MSVSEGIFEQAMKMMQRASEQHYALCKAKLPYRTPLNAIEVKELCQALETLALGLDQDSLLCQSAADKSKQEDDLNDDAPSDFTWPASSPDLHPDECLSHKDHIETFWGVDYDSDAMPNFSD